MVLCPTVSATGISQGQKWQRILAIKKNLATNEVSQQCTQRVQFLCLGDGELFLFLMSSQTCSGRSQSIPPHVPQVLNVFCNMLPIPPHFYPISFALRSCNLFEQPKMRRLQYIYFVTVLSLITYFFVMSQSMMPITNEKFELRGSLQMCHSIIRGFPTLLGTYMSHKFCVIETLEPVGKMHISSPERRFCVSDFLMNFRHFAKYILEKEYCVKFSFLKIKNQPKTKMKIK